MSFEQGQQVVYPNHGVGVIEKIEESEIDEVTQVYYHLRLLSNNSKVMVPEGNLDLVGLRPLVTQEQVEELVGILGDGEIDTYKDWKGRYKQNLDKMKTGDLMEVAEVLKNLRLVSQRKSLSFREKKMYERAKYFIVSELAQVKEISERKAEALVENALETSIEKRKKAQEKEKEREKEREKQKEKEKEEEEEKEKQKEKEKQEEKAKEKTKKEAKTKKAS